MNKENLKHFIHGDKLLIDLEYSGGLGTEIISGQISTRPKQRYIVREEWTNETKKNLYKQGYRKAKNFKSDLIFLRCPVFIRFHGFYKFDVMTLDKPKLDTASSQYDFFNSTATKDFERGLAKKKLSDLDQKSIIMIVIVAIGFGLGLFMLM